MIHSLRSNDRCIDVFNQTKIPKTIKRLELYMGFFRGFSALYSKVELCACWTTTTTRQETRALDKLAKLWSQCNLLFASSLQTIYRIYCTLNEFSAPRHHHHHGFNAQQYTHLNWKHTIFNAQLVSFKSTVSRNASMALTWL